MNELDFNLNKAITYLGLDQLSGFSLTRLDMDTKIVGLKHKKVFCLFEREISIDTIYQIPSDHKLTPSLKNLVDRNELENIIDGIIDGSIEYQVGEFNPSFETFSGCINIKQLCILDTEYINSFNDIDFWISFGYAENKSEYEKVDLVEFINISEGAISMGEIGSYDEIIYETTMDDFDNSVSWYLDEIINNNERDINHAFYLIT